MNNERIGVGAYLKNYVKQSVEVFKHPLKLLPTLVLGAVWIVIGYFSGKMELPLWGKIVSFLSFAEGGLFGGVVGAIGGILGKVVMAVAVNSAILPLFEKKWPFVGVAGGIKGMFSNMGMSAARGVSPLLCGIGAALLLYRFMNISENWVNSMVGIVAVVMLWFPLWTNLQPCKLVNQRTCATLSDYNPTTHRHDNRIYSCRGAHCCRTSHVHYPRRSFPCYWSLAGSRAQYQEAA